MNEEKNEFQNVTVKEDNRISISLEEYKTLIAENTKYKAQVEVLNKPTPNVALEIEQSHVRPQPKERRRLF